MTIQIAGTTIIDQSRNIIQSTLQNYTETVNNLGTLTAGTTNINLASGNVITATLPTSGTVTFSFTTGVTTGTVAFALYLTNPASGSAVLVWPGTVKFTGVAGSGPVSTVNKIHIWTFISFNNGSSWYGSLAQSNL